MLELHGPWAPDIARKRANVVQVRVIHAHSSDNIVLKPNYDETPFTVNDHNADEQNGGNFLYKFLCRQNFKISSGRNLIRSTVEDNDSVSTLHIHCIDTRREEKPKETPTTFKGKKRRGKLVVSDT